MLVLILVRASLQHFMDPKYCFAFSTTLSAITHGSQPSTINVIVAAIEYNKQSSATMGSYDPNSDDEDGSNNPLGSGLGAILKFTGSNVPARARFIGEAFVSASLFSVTIGLCCGAVGATIFPIACGPLIPFLTGSSLGYSIGLYEHFWNVKRNMRFYAQHYPTLLAHALWTEHHVIVPKSVLDQSRKQLREQRQENNEISPSSTTAVSSESMLPSPRVTYRPQLENLPLDQWVFCGGLGRLSWSMLASQNCSSNVTTIETQKRQRIVDSLLDEAEEEQTTME